MRRGKKSTSHFVGPFFLHIMVGIAQLVSAPDCGSGGPGFESQYPPLGLYRIKMQAVSNIGLSPSGKAQDFDSCMHQFESG